MYKVLTCPKCKVTSGVVVCEPALVGESALDLFECGHCHQVFSERQASNPSEAAGIAGRGLALISDSEAEALSVEVVTPRALDDDMATSDDRPHRMGLTGVFKRLSSAFKASKPASAVLEAAQIAPLEDSQAHPDVQALQSPAKPDAAESSWPQAAAQQDVEPTVADPKLNALLPARSEPELLPVQPIESPHTELEALSFMLNHPKNSAASGKWRFACILLAPLLVATALYAVWADSRRLAANPSLTNLIQAYCLVAGCDTRPILDIEPMAITTSTFTENADGQYSFGFSLMNTGAQNLAVPNVQIYFIDSKDRTVMTRLVTANQILSGRQHLLSGQTVAVLFDLTLPPTVKPLVAGYKLAVVNANGLPPEENKPI